MRIFGILASIAVAALAAGAVDLPQKNAPLPDIPVLLHQVQEHQKALEKIRENYTFSSRQTTQDLDPGGRVTRTETAEYDEFFVNGHVIQRMTGKDGRPLDAHDDQKETDRVTKLVEKAEKTPPDQALEGPTVSVSRILELMDARNERRENFRGRPTIVFDFVGRKDAKTHGLAEDVSKKLSGTIWIDEQDREVAHLEVTFTDNFRLMGGLVATIEKGSRFQFDQALVNGELWLPTGGEGNVQARVLLLKNYRQHIVEQDFDFKRFKVEAVQGKDAKAVPHP